MSAASTGCAALAQSRSTDGSRAPASRLRRRSKVAKFAPLRVWRLRPIASRFCRRRSAALTPCNAACAPPASLFRSIIISLGRQIRARAISANFSAATSAAAPATCRSSRRHSTPRKDCVRPNAMLDLGTSFLASVARDPQALAIVDGPVRMSYAEWYRKISSLVAGFDEMGLMPGDHLVTVLQNRWEAATIHWACQFAGIVITPVNWRAKSDELDFCIENSESRAVIYEAVSAEAVAGSKLGH